MEKWVSLLWSATGWILFSGWLVTFIVWNAPDDDFYNSSGFAPDGLFVQHREFFSKNTGWPFAYLKHQKSATCAESQLYWQPLIAAMNALFATIVQIAIFVVFRREPIQFIFTLRALFVFITILGLTIACGRAAFFSNSYQVWWAFCLIIYCLPMFSCIYCVWGTRERAGEMTVSEGQAK